MMRAGASLTENRFFNNCGGKLFAKTGPILLDSNTVREKLERYKTAAKADKEADRTEPALSKEKSKTPEPNRQTVHTQPKKHKKSKER